MLIQYKKGFRYFGNLFYFNYLSTAIVIGIFDSNQILFSIV